MLSVAQVIPLPRRSWIITDIEWDHNARKEMSDWLHELEEAQKRIPERLSLIQKMLQRLPKDRITASDLTKSLRGLRNTKSRLLRLEAG